MCYDVSSQVYFQRMFSDISGQVLFTPELANNLHFCLQLGKSLMRCPVSNLRKTTAVFMPLALLRASTPRRRRERTTSATCSGKRPTWMQPSRSSKVSRMHRQRNCTGFVTSSRMPKAPSVAVAPAWVRPFHARGASQGMHPYNKSVMCDRVSAMHAG